MGSSRAANASAASTCELDCPVAGVQLLASAMRLADAAGIGCGRGFGAGDLRLRAAALAPPGE
eukprot:1993949-Pleurochrysis_carterae.AAC.2